MKLVLESRDGVRVCDWESYALLRDNVQHFLEAGSPLPRFRALHAFERAVDADPQRVDASRLRGEVLRAWSALWWKNFEDAAISPRTRAVLTNNPEPPSSEKTIAAKDAHWELPLAAPAETPIPKAASRFVQAVLSLTKTAEDGDWLSVRRVGDAPSFARPQTVPSPSESGSRR